MKKLILAMLFAVFNCLFAIAGDDIKLSEGSVASLKDGGIGRVVLDMKETTYDSEKPLRSNPLFSQVDSQLSECTSEFIKEFNNNSKKFELTSNAKVATYEFYVKITNLDTFVNVMSFKGGVGIKLWGYITIKNVSTGETIAVFTMNEESNSGFNYEIALEEGFEGIAKFLAKRINKGK